MRSLVHFLAQPLMPFGLGVALLASSVPAQMSVPSPEPTGGPPLTSHYLDLDQDGDVDLLRSFAGGRLEIALQNAPQQFVPSVQPTRVWSNSRNQASCTSAVGASVGSRIGAPT